jgi:hypothetical protein
LGVDLLSELSRALKRHQLALEEYRHRVEANGQPDELELFRSSAVAPTLEECEQLVARSMGEEKRLIEQLRQCHEECVKASFELRNPPRSLFPDEYKKLAEKVKAHEASCHEIRGG